MVPVRSVGRLMSSSFRNDTIDVEAGVVEDKATSTLPLALRKSTRILGVKFGPRPGIQVSQNVIS